MSARDGLRFADYREHHHHRHHSDQSTFADDSEVQASRRPRVVTERQYSLYSRCSRSLVQLRGSRVDALGKVNSVYGEYKVITIYLFLEPCLVINKQA